MSLRAHFIQQFKAMYTCNLHSQISHLCYICSIHKYLQLMSLRAHLIQQFKAMHTCNLHLQISHLCCICSVYKYLQLMSMTAHFIQQFKAMYTCNLLTSVTSVLFTNTVYVDDSTFYTTVQGNVHMQFILANQSPLLHLFYLQTLYYGIPITICSTLLMAEKGLNYSVSQKKSDMSAGHT